MSFLPVALFFWQYPGFAERTELWETTAEGTIVPMHGRWSVQPWSKCWRRRSRRRRRTQAFTLHLVQVLPVLVVLWQVLYQIREAGKSCKNRKVLDKRKHNMDTHIHWLRLKLCDEQHKTVHVFKSMWLRLGSPTCGCRATCGSLVPLQGLYLALLKILKQYFVVTPLSTNVTE